MAASKKSNDMVLVKREAFNNIMDGLKANIYVTDVNTDEIIFMNKTMKDDFGVTAPEGKICWQILQKGMNARCEFCPLDNLKKLNDKSFVYRWDEINSVTHREYRNYDCLLEWVDGRMAHFQQSIDVTELNAANTDELTMFLTRKAGKIKLKELLAQCEAERQYLTVCLYDINLLKEINDTYGHHEGDFLIVSIANAVRKGLRNNEFAFRLSGDEFIIVFMCRRHEAEERAEKIKLAVDKQNRSYEMSFCCGFADFVPSRPATVDELLFAADKRMYEQKRNYHIALNNTKLGTITEKYSDDSFEYSKEKLYDALVQSTDDYIYVCNMKTGIFKYSAAMVEEFRLPQQIIRNAAAVWGEKVHPGDKAAFLQANQDIADGRTAVHCVEYRAKNNKDEWVWVRCRGHLELDDRGEPLLFAGFITNLGKKNKIDTLTGLFNKLEFCEQTERLISEKQPFSIMLLGVDDLKHINDLYNRSFGDEVLRAASQSIQALLPDNVTLYRLDGDVFGLIAPDKGVNEMTLIYRSVYQSFERQQSFEGKKYYCSFSAGCLFYPQDACSYEDLTTYGHYCMEFSKKNGKKRCTYYSPNILNERTHSLSMLELLRESIEHNFLGFKLVFQPIVNAATGLVVGAEALARWECRQFGKVTPAEFIPLLEGAGLIVPAGKWILRNAMITCRKWISQNKDFVVHVNISSIQIQEPDFLHSLRSVLQAESFNPHNLVLELTESYFIKVTERVHSIFKEIRSMGISIAMDDFGTGYSTLGILKEAPADIVKIDKTFIRGIDNSIFDATFIKFVVELCHNVGITVCLEGVEVKETYNTVLPMGLDFIQGYFFGKPVDANEFSKLYFNL